MFGVEIYTKIQLKKPSPVGEGGPTVRLVDEAFYVSLQ